VRLYAEAYHAILRRPLHGGFASSTVPVSVEPKGRTTQIQGIDLEQAVAQEPHLQGVVERVNRALSLGRTQMAVRMVQKELGHRAEAARILALLEQPQLTAVS
jgi:hypothetical protein